MKQACRVHGRERVTQRLADSHRFVCAKMPDAAHPIGERFTVDQVHHETDFTADAANRVYGHDVRVTHPREHLPFAHHGRNARFVGGTDDFERDLLREPFVEGAVHPAKAAAAQLADDPELAPVRWGVRREHRRTGARDVHRGGHVR